jgi:hypothetical protein
MRNPRRLKVRRLPHIIHNLHEPLPHPPEYYFPTLPEEASWIPPLIINDDVITTTIFDGHNAITNDDPALLMKPAVTDHFDPPPPIRYE